MTKPATHKASVQSQPLIAVRDVRASRRWYQQLLGVKGLPEHEHRDSYDRLLSSGRWSAGQAILSTPHDELTSVSCASTTFCVAVDDEGYVFEYASGVWSSREVLSAPTPLVTVSCLNSIFCIAVDRGGSTYTYVDGSWTPGNQVLGPGIVTATCTAQTVCNAITAGGAVLTSFGPNGWGGGKAVTGVESSGRHYPFTAMSCVMAFCMSVDGGGEAFSSVLTVNESPSVLSKRGLVKVAPTGSSFTSVSCAFESTPFCVAVDDHGTSFAYMGSSWGKGEILPDGTNGPAYVSCATPVFCVVADRSGSSFIRTGRGWSKGASLKLSGNAGSTGDGVASISCATSMQCIAVSNRGLAYTFTASGHRWSPSSEYKDGWNSFIVNGIKNVGPACTGLEGTPTTDSTRGCADAARATASAGASPPTTYPTNN